MRGDPFAVAMTAVTPNIVAIGFFNAELPSVQFLAAKLRLGFHDVKRLSERMASEVGGMPENRYF